MKTNIHNPSVQYEKHGQVAYITLNRPEVLNAMDLQMHAELSVILDDFESDDNIYIGVITGAGDKAFSVGQDLKELSELQRTGMIKEASFGSRGKAGSPRLTERFDRIKPLIAKVHGYALGGGFELALACDIIVATHDAKFALPEAKLGLIPGAGGVFRLIRQIAFRAALGYLITGRTITAEKALQLGLLNDVVSINEIDLCVDGWVQDILRCAPLSVRAIKEAASKSINMTIEEAFDARYTLEEIRKASIDAQEGPKAFIEKRTPLWRCR
jgi:dehydration protein DpgD